MNKKIVAITLAAAMVLPLTAQVSVLAEETPKLTIFVDETWWPYDTWEGAVPEEFEKRLGVDIEVIRAADDNQLALMVSSGDMPDLICSWRYQYLADSSVCYPLDELIAEYSDITFEPDATYQFVNKTADGHFYTIGCGFSPDYEYAQWEQILTEGPGFMFRKDIADELGLTIETLEDLDTAFAAVKEAYPDMTVCTFNCSHKFNWLMQQMGIKNGGYYETEDGTLKWWLEQEELLDFYKKVNEWYRNGYIAAENFAYQSEDETKEVCVSGNVFANFGYDNHADNYNTAIGVNGDDFTFSLVTDELSEDCVAYNTSAGGRGLYITRSAENVEAAFKTLAYAYSDEGMKLLMWGIEGEDYTLNEEGYPTFTYDFQGDNNVLQPRGLKYWGWLVHNNIVTSIAEATSESQTATDRKNLSAYVDINPVIGMIRFETDSVEANTQAKLDEMVNNQQTNIFMADSEEACVAAYNEMMELAAQIGIDKLDTYANAAYPEMKAEFDEVVATASAE